MASGAAAADLPPINSPATLQYYSGKFIWADLITADPGGAAKFYAALFGWTAKTIDRNTSFGVRSYTVLSLADRPIAGIVTRSARMNDEEHGRWVGYVSVPDVDRALGQSRSCGGRVLSSAKDRPQRGTQAILIDPEGAILGVMHSSAGDPGEYLPDTGEWAWAELFSRDPSAAGQFYGKVVGYGLVPDNAAVRPNSFVLVSGSYSRAGIVVLPNRPRARSNWLLFVRVASVRDSAARVASLGGRVLVTPADTPREDWRAVISDPSGARLGLVELEDPGATTGAVNK
jgi:predicted enzyme related to lactoylglutathione lyase